ncbi:hypothetical protein PMAYCL1PPCAC_19827 [Pristionchus mayeri]|uniref:Uncharacterized protein n=1 Tax=Pristionchus mayeri TaxID=1317129 RepID=A0AAN5I2J9_9BILA|nr:hypothetical protein PMAYCL1PPCAC_19827 [Pristionchus mayeri]
MFSARLCIILIAIIALSIFGLVEGQPQPAPATGLSAGKLLSQLSQQFEQAASKFGAPVAKPSVTSPNDVPPSTTTAKPVDDVSTTPSSTSTTTTTTTTSIQNPKMTSSVPVLSLLPAFAVMIIAALL